MGIIREREGLPWESQVKERLPIPTEGTQVKSLKSSPELASTRRRATRKGIPPLQEDERENYLRTVEAVEIFNLSQSTFNRLLQDFPNSQKRREGKKVYYPTEELKKIAEKASRGRLDRVYPEDPTENLLTIYLEDDKTPLLSREEEGKIFEVIRRGEQAAEILGQNTNLPPEDKEVLKKAIKQGKEARDQVINANKYLVLSIAKRFTGRGVSLPDLIQDGNIGLIYAVDRFDRQLGFKLSTYATWWIRQAITRGISTQGRNIRLPVHTLEKVWQLQRVRIKLTQELSRNPTTSEIAKSLGAEVKEVEKIIKIIKQEPLSLNEAVNPQEGEDSDFFGDFLKDEKSPQPGEVTADHLRREVIEEILGDLSPREAKILRLRFGLDDGQNLTLQEIADEFGCSRERIRQIEAKALRRLRHPLRARKLRGFLRE